MIPVPSKLLRKTCAPNQFERLKLDIACRVEEMGYGKLDESRTKPLRTYQRLRVGEWVELNECLSKDPKNSVIRRRSQCDACGSNSKIGVKPGL